MPAPTEMHSQNSGVFDDRVIPPSHNARTVVLCIDGTASNLFNGADSNVIRFFKMLKEGDESQQVVHYQPGIGTYTDSKSEISLWSNLDKAADKAFAHHLGEQVMNGYRFLMKNYHEGDKICIFGFSRGAYTARALAGMINQVGLLPARDLPQVPFAYKLYSEKKWEECAVFKKTSSNSVKIEFVGVWDTVSSVGLVPRFLPYTASNPCIRHFRHAVSIDERRAKFRANLFKSNVSEHDSSHDVQEVWFAGCHTDIGGGTVESGPRNNLSRIPLRWMVRQCFLANTGIQFKREAFIPIGLDPATLFPKVAPVPQQLDPSAPFVAGFRDSTCPDSHHTDDDQVSVQKAACTFISEGHEELLDALSPLNDHLASWFSPWWILEYIPFVRYKQDKSDPNNSSRWISYWRLNRGSERHIPKPDPENKEKKKVLVHRSVDTRTNAGKYKPNLKVKFEGYKIEWVE